MSQEDPPILIFLFFEFRHNKNYMEGLNSKNKNIKGDGSP